MRRIARSARHAADRPHHHSQLFFAANLAALCDVRTATARQSGQIYLGANWARKNALNLDPFDFTLKRGSVRGMKTHAFE
jgi:hypothetical protein